MIEGRVILCLASAWDYDPTCKHQIMRILSGSNDVVWVNYHGTRRPTVSTNDAWASLRALGKVFRGTRRIHDRMVQTTPLVIPGARHAASRWLHETLLLRQLRRALARINPRGDRPVQVWSFAPDVPFLVGRFGEERFVYYCTDEYSEFEDFDREAVIRSERKMIEKADVVMATSEVLWQTKRRLRPDAMLMRHGVDFDHFARAWRENLEPAADAGGGFGPVFGFFGLIHHWIDCDLIAEVARLRPEYTFVLIGDRRVDVGSLARCANVRLIGHRPYESLPAYCAAFDGALLPFKRSRMTRNINPIKMYEYLAAGLPVISTDLPEARRFPRAITIVDGAAAFAAACDRIAVARSHDRARAIAEQVRDQSWQARVQSLCEVVMQPRRGRLPSGTGLASATEVAAETAARPLERASAG